MILNEIMINSLHAIRRIESKKVSKSLDLPANDLGNRLIEIYYQSSNLNTRELITSFMSQAGDVWLRKLLTKDTSKIESSPTRFASMGDYMNLLAANDAEMDCGLVG